MLVLERPDLPLIQDRTKWMMHTLSQTAVHTKHTHSFIYFYQRRDMHTYILLVNSIVLMYTKHNTQTYLKLDSHAAASYLWVLVCMCLTPCQQLRLYRGNCRGARVHIGASQRECTHVVARFN